MIDKNFKDKIMIVFRDTQFQYDVTLPIDAIEDKELEDIVGELTQILYKRKKLGPFYPLYK